MDALSYSLDRIGAVTLVAIVVCTLAALFVNINKFSLHAMYRDRLIRAFLGASRAPFPWAADAIKARPDVHGGFDRKWNEDSQFIDRKGNSYTDFDRHDNPILAWLSRHKNGAKMPRASSKTCSCMG